MTTTEPTTGERILARRARQRAEVRTLHAVTIDTEPLGPDGILRARYAQLPPLLRAELRRLAQEGRDHIPAPCQRCSHLVGYQAQHVTEPYSRTEWVWHVLILVQEDERVTRFCTLCDPLRAVHA